jgi:hypothetical protein
MRLVTSSGSPNHNRHLNLRRVIELPRLQLVCARVKDPLVGVAIVRARRSLLQTTLDDAIIPDAQTTLTESHCAAALAVRELPQFAES